MLPLGQSLDYAVIPLDPENIHIDFEKATIPLKPEVIEAGEKWYTDYDDGGYFLGKLLKPFLEKAYNKKDASYKYKSDFKASSIPIDDIKNGLHVCGICIICLLVEKEQPGHYQRLLLF